jgi:hypothetical protein
MVDKPYRSVLSLVMWGQLVTHPDLSYLVSLLARFQANLGIEHWKALVHVIGYIKIMASLIHEIQISLLLCSSMQTTEDVRILIDLHPDMFSLWLGELSPGVANNRPPLHCLLLKQSTWRCQDVLSKCHGCIAGQMRSRLSILFLE